MNRRLKRNAPSVGVVYNDMGHSRRTITAQTAARRWMEVMIVLKIRPIDFKSACNFVDLYHRHHKSPVGHKFSISVYNDDNLVGVAMVGRPVSRILDDGLTLEVNRLCTDGTKNACSMLYSSAWRAAKAMGYTRIITYTLCSEPGTSLRAAGWVCQGLAGGERWTGKRSGKEPDYPKEKKIRWVKMLGNNGGSDDD